MEGGFFTPWATLTPAVGVSFVLRPHGDGLGPCGVVLDAVASFVCPCHGRKAQKMTLIHRIQPRTTRAIFAILWAVVLLTRFEHIDQRALQGSSTISAPRPPKIKIFV
jgi:hypothetical protein